MAYPTVADACLDEHHETCVGHAGARNTPTGEPIAGGWFCICICHLPDKHKPNFNRAWFNQVKQQAIEARQRNQAQGG